MLSEVCFVDLLTWFLKVHYSVLSIEIKKIKKELVGVTMLKSSLEAGQMCNEGWDEKITQAKMLRSIDSIKHSVHNLIYRKAGFRV